MQCTTAFTLSALAVAEVSALILAMIPTVPGAASPARLPHQPLVANKNIHRKQANRVNGQQKQTYQRANLFGTNLIKLLHLCNASLVAGVQPSLEVLLVRRRVTYMPPRR